MPMQQRQRNTASLFTKPRHHRPLVTFYFCQRMIFRVGPEYAAYGLPSTHQRLFFAVVKQPR